MNASIPEDINPYIKKKFEAIPTYDPYESAISDLNHAFHHSYNMLIHETCSSLGKAEHQSSLY